MNKPTAFSALLVFCFGITLFTSCVSRKDFAYFSQGQVSALKPYRLLIKTDDLLSVIVSCADPELAVPFNPYINIASSQAPGYTNGFAGPPGYVVNSNGEIDFPVIGKVKLLGLTREEASSLLREKLLSYLKDPVVTVRLINFKVSVLGDVKSPGSFNIPNERITLPEAIAIAGDLNNTAQRKNILVVRTEGEKKTEFRVDLTSQDVFQSPAFFLQQGDLVYVEANRAQRNASGINSRMSIVVSFASLIITTSVLLFR